MSSTVVSFDPVPNERDAAIDVTDSRRGVLLQLDAPFVSHALPSARSTMALDGPNFSAVILDAPRMASGLSEVIFDVPQAAINVNVVQTDLPPPSAADATADAAPPRARVNNQFSDDTFLTLRTDIRDQTIAAATTRDLEPTLLALHSSGCLLRYKDRFVPFLELSAKEWDGNLAKALKEGRNTSTKLEANKQLFIPRPGNSAATLAAGKALNDALDAEAADRLATQIRIRTTSVEYIASAMVGTALVGLVLLLHTELAIFHNPFRVCFRRAARRRLSFALVSRRHV